MRQHAVKLEASVNHPIVTATVKAPFLMDLTFCL